VATLGPGARDALPASGAVLDSEARTATTTSEVFSTQGASGLIAVIDVSAITGTPSVVFTVEGVTYPTGPGGREVTWTLLASAAVVAANDEDAPTVLQIDPRIASAANSKAEALLPDRVRVVATHADGDSITYSVIFILVP
jgi:hypothetical protein